MYLRCVPAGAVSANCYVLCDEKTKVGAVIDVGEFNKSIESAIADSGMKELKYILCTHGHFDHVSGVADLKKRYPDAKICIGKPDSPLLCDEYLNLATHFGAPYSPCYADVELESGDKIAVGEIEFEIYSAPGHTPGGVLYVSNGEKAIFTGDTLFYGSVGRTDLVGGDTQTLLKTLQKFKNFPKDYMIFSGHGISSSIGRELERNMYLR